MAEVGNDETSKDGIETGSSNDISIARLPQKKFFRQRAHANPFSDHLLE